MARTKQEADMKAMLPQEHPVTGEPFDWELISDWSTVLGDETSTDAMFQEQIWEDKSGNWIVPNGQPDAGTHLMRNYRHHPDRAEEMQATEQVHAMAREALTDAGEEVTADGILWLEAVHNAS